MITLKAENLGRRDGRQQRVLDFNLSLNKGETVGLLGINGAGKSTALALLSGALAPTSGKVQIMGEDLHRQRRARRHIGLLPEKPALYPELTVDENLEFAARIRGIPRARIAAAKLRIMRRCDLLDVGKRLTGRLSRGYQQRTGIAQALIHSPAVLALDEPSVGLDPAQAVQLRSLIQSIATDCSIVIASHILLDMEQLCQRVLVLRGGQLVSEHSLTEQGHRRVRLQLARPPNAAQLAEMPGVLKVDTLEGGWFRLHNDDTNNQLAQHIANQDWGMISYAPESLEQRLLLDQLTGDAA